MASISIANFFKNKSVLVTGASGFLGKIVVQKLLRACPEISGVYIMIRPKNGVSAVSRFSKYLSDPVFSTLHQARPDWVKQLGVVQGDLSIPHLGLHSADLESVIQNVNVVIHSAATISFTEPLRVALDVNYMGTKRVLDMSLHMKKIKSVVHISTAYAPYRRDQVEEKVYPPFLVGQDAESILADLSEMGSARAKSYEKRLLGDIPNTYIFSKNLTESLVESYSDRLPLAIVRPPIVGATLSDPVPGYVDSFAAATGIFYLMGTNLTPVIGADKRKKCELIPADLCANAILAAAAAAPPQRTKRPATLAVYNCTRPNPRTNGYYTHAISVISRSIPFDNKHGFRFPITLVLNSRLIVQGIYVLFVYLPAIILDVIMYPSKREFRYLRLSRSLRKRAAAWEAVSRKEWTFNRSNLIALFSSLDDASKRNFPITNEITSEEEYLRLYALGIQKYLG